MPAQCRAARKRILDASARAQAAGVSAAAITAACAGVPHGEAHVIPHTGGMPAEVELPPEVHENVRSTQAEYMSVAAERADAGFDTLSAVCEHATDMLMVRDTYMRSQ